MKSAVIVRDHHSKQSSNSILMIEPVAFGYNAETGVDNDFQHKPADVCHTEIAERARSEMRGVKAVLEQAGIKVTSFLGQPDCPDDVFPNNWLSTTPRGDFVIYPMATKSRSRERRPDIMDWLRHDYRLLADYSAVEMQGRSLEGTGVLIQDHIHRRAFVARSERTDDDLLAVWANQTGYEAISFNTEVPATGKPVYHTNVICHIGTGYAAICPEMIKTDERDQVLGELSRHHEIITLSASQIHDFCGNALEVSRPDGQRYLALSTRAYNNLNSEQLRKYEQHLNGFLHSPIPTIEKYGGGSVRCMMCELF